MKVLLYSHNFHPAIGGLETVSLALANGFAQNNIDCVVVTTSAGNDDSIFPFKVVRQPNRKQQIDLVKWADVVLFNGASMALQPWLLWYRKPFMWTHVGYQVSCIDGLGWVEGEAAPIKPLASVIYHIKRKGIVWGVKEGFKLALRRFIAKHLVTKNIAITKWMNDIQPLPRQVHIYNPFPINQFLGSAANTNFEYDFIFLGRIVSEKGVPTLLNAFHILLQQNPQIDSKLLIIGDGKWRDKMEALCHSLDISAKVTFAGKQSGQALVDWVSKGQIAVIPSEWFEPMGGVALELMAAGKNLIVSELGGLKECVGNVGLTFMNGDANDLAACMAKLLHNKQLRDEQKAMAAERIKLFDPSIFVAQYIEVLKSAVNTK